MFEYATGVIPTFLLYNQAMLTPHKSLKYPCYMLQSTLPLLLSNIPFDVHWVDGPVFPCS